MVRGPVQFVTRPGLSLWFFRTCLGFRGTPPDIQVALSCFGMRSSSSPLPRLGALGDSMLCLFLALFPGARLWCPLLSPQVLWRTLRPLSCSSVCGLYCTGPTNARQSQWETVISCAGGQGLPGPLWLCIVSDASGSLLPHGVTGRSYRRQLSPSSSGCRCHGGADSRPWNGLFRVRCARCFRATAPSLLCEELCCHPGGGTKVWLSRSTCEATWGLPLLGCSQASTGSVW